VSKTRKQRTEAKLQGAKENLKGEVAKLADQNRGLKGKNSDLSQTLAVVIPLLNDEQREAIGGLPDERQKVVEKVVETFTPKDDDND
jgi:hypothetical protein